MFRLDKWVDYRYSYDGNDPIAPDATYWFTTEQLRDEFLEAAEIADEDDSIWVRGSGPADPTPVIDPPKPEVGHLYSLTWSAATGLTTETDKIVSPARQQTEPAIGKPILHPTATGYPITTIRWRHKVAGQFDKVEICGTDRARLGEVLSETVDELKVDGKITAADILAQIAEANAEESATYFEPILELERALNSAMSLPLALHLESTSQARNKLFELRAELRPKYLGALALAQAEAGVTVAGEDATPSEIPDLLLNENERWRAATDRMWPKDWQIPPVVPPAPESGPPAPTMGQQWAPSSFLGMMAPSWAAAEAYPRLGRPASLTQPMQVMPDVPPMTASFLTTSPVKIASAYASALERGAEQLESQVKPWLLSAVRAERAQGRSWQDIGDDLGISRQAAQQRYGKELGEQ